MSHVWSLATAESRVVCLVGACGASVPFGFKMRACQSVSATCQCLFVSDATSTVMVWCAAGLVRRSVKVPVWILVLPPPCEVPDAFVVFGGMSPVVCAMVTIIISTTRPARCAAPSPSPHAAHAIPFTALIARCGRTATGAPRHLLPRRGWAGRGRERCARPSDWPRRPRLLVTGLRAALCGRTRHRAG